MKLCSMLAPFLLSASVSFSLQAQEANAVDQSPVEEVRELKLLVRQLESRVAQLEAQQSSRQENPATARDQNSAATAESSESPAQALSRQDRGVLDFFRSTTLNLGIDGYYDYNFNHPVGGVNLLRAYDVSSNSFSLNQANLILEQAADPNAGRRLGARLDLQFGQATETLQGSATNELRPQVYRAIWQAYGTYVFPAGTGLTVDFGKWSSALGPEGNYSKDQMNYSRSYWFDFLPFYHMGVRATYNFTPKLAFSYWLVNGVNQTEDFNGFKSQNFEFVARPMSTLTWTGNYYFGQEGRTVVPVLNPGVPTLPTQPGLPLQMVVPEPNGREHIVDNYLAWGLSNRLTLGGEFDYVINRQFAHSSPAHVIGGAGYLRYQLTGKAAGAARVEYLSDRGGLFSGTTQALKETTLTYEYRLADGFLTRMEWRRDFSNQPFFLSDRVGAREKAQTTATLGLVWWWGRKTGPW